MRRVLKIFAWTGGAVALLVAVLVCAVLIAGNTDGGRALIERLTARMTAGHVQLSGLTGSFPAALDLGALRLSDERGVWLVAERISLRWSPLALLARHVNVQSLHIGRLDIERLPVRRAQTTPSRSLSVPRCDLRQLSIDSLQLGTQLAGAPVSLVVHANAHLQSLQDAAAAVVAQRTGGIGDYEVRLKFDPARMDATVRLREPAHGPLEHLLQLPGLGELSVLATLSGPRTAEALAVNIDAGQLHARAGGKVDLPGRSGDLEYSVSAPAMEPHPGLSWQRVGLSGRWHGTLSAPTADGRLEVKELQVPGGTRIASANANLRAVEGRVSAHAVIDGLAIPGPEPTLLQDTLTLDGSMRLDEAGRPLELTASQHLFTLKAHAVTAGQQSGELELHWLDLAPLGQLAGQSLAGDCAIKAQVARHGEDTQVTVNADTNLVAGTAMWVQALRARSRLQLAAAVNTERLVLERMSLQGAAVSLAMSGTAERTAARRLKGHLDLTVTDLARMSQAVAGNLKLTANMSGPRDSLSTDAQLTSTLSVRGSPSGTITATVHASGLPSTPRGTVLARGDLDGAPLLVDVALQRADASTLHAVIRHADWKSAHIDADLVSGTDIEHARGTAQLRMTRLADLDRILGSAIRGSVEGKLALTQVAGRPRAELRFEARDVVTANVTTDTEITAAGALDALGIQISLHSPAIAGEPASLASQAQLDLTRRLLRLTGAEAQYRGQTLRLLSPATASFASGLSIRGMKLGAQQATLELDGALSPQLDVRASLRQLKPDLINAFVPHLLASGTIEADAQVHGTLSAPEGTARLEAIGMKSANQAANGLPATDLHASAQLMRDTARLDVKLAAGSASQLALSGDAPLSRQGRLDLKFAGRLDVALLNPMLEAGGRHATGELNIETTVAGDLAAPQIGGTIELAKGSLRDYAQGINLSDIKGRITGNQQLLRIESLTARAAPGSLSVAGTIGALQPGVPVDIHVTGKNAQPIASNIVTANLDTDLRISGTARKQLEVAGRLHINRANIEIPSSLPPNVAVLDVRRPGQAAPPPRKETPLVIGLNITVDAPREILVKGRGLDAELGGRLRIQGTTASPMVSGSFELQRGTFSLASSRLTFSSGSVTFNGAGLRKKIDPTLDFTAQSTAAEVTVTLRVTGFADAPKIQLSSTPELPQDEILARLLFGTSASQLTALQVVQIGAALASLGGGGGGLNPLAKIQKSLGLDRLSIGGGTSTGGNGTGSTANSGATIEAGRYVSSRVFVAVKESTTGVSQLAVDVDLSKHLKLQTRLGNGTASAQGTTPENDPGSSIGIAYQFEY